jgi:S-adenosylmethionine synthetase
LNTHQTLLSSSEKLAWVSTKPREDQGPDAKAQVSVELDADGHATFQTIVLSSQHAPQATLADVRSVLRSEVIQSVFPELGADVRLLINPAGQFTEGGPVADAGLPGRNIVADTYGGIGRHGGGAFSGKDATKVDRSAAYGARQLACTVVDGELAPASEVQLAYAIGVAEPAAIHIDVEESNQAVLAGWDAQAMADLFTPRSLMDRLDLTSAQYEATARNGHFGAERSWDRAISADRLEAV